MITRESLLNLPEQYVIKVLTDNKINYKIIVRDGSAIGWIDNHVDNRFSLHIKNNIVYEITFG